VPATEKLVSLFEAHTDVIVKDRRATYYGHKVFLTTGRSGLILDCAIPQGNPADVTWAGPLVRRHTRRFGTAPRQVSMDGGFASRDNLAALKAAGVTDVCFAKKRGLAVADMTRSQWVYDKLRRFRAAIEAGISLLKRVFGLARCVWKGGGLSRLRPHGGARRQRAAARARDPPVTHALTYPHGSRDVSVSRELVDRPIVAWQAIPASPPPTGKRPRCLLAHSCHWRRKNAVARAQIPCFKTDTRLVQPAAPRAPRDS
jgi:IS5 family transposase